MNDLLGLAPAYLADGQTAYAAGIVASWPEHNRARFKTLLFTGEQLETAVATERAESARLRRLLNLARDDYNTAAQRLQDIGDYAHDHSTGPAVPDALWEVRSMAYGSGA